MNFSGNGFADFAGVRMASDIRGARPVAPRTDSMARSIAAAAAVSPRWCSIIAPDQIWPIGLAMPRRMFLILITRDGTGADKVRPIFIVVTVVDEVVAVPRCFRERR
jgi:hypothetical protein